MKDGAAASDPSGGLREVGRPLRHEGAWVFDEPRVGLCREPFVAGVTEMIDRLVAGIRDAGGEFRLIFAAVPFEGYQAVLNWVRADRVEGHWYRAEGQGDEGWLCPAMFWFFPAAPQKIYVWAESKGCQTKLTPKTTLS